MSLPKWIDIQGCGCSCHKDGYLCEQCCIPTKLIQAISIAWEALAKYQKGDCLNLTHDDTAEDAMRRIEKLVK